MKAILVLVLLSTMASATSIQRYDRWTCYFPEKSIGSMVRGYNVNVDYDLALGKGTASMYADCPACMVAPRQMLVERSGHEQALIYSNSKEGFYLRIFWTNSTPANGPYTSTWNNRTGTCVPKR